MKVKVTKSFASVPKETDLHPVFYKPGDVVEHYAAEVALKEGWGERISADTDGANAAPAAGATASTSQPRAAKEPLQVIPVVDVTPDPYRARVKRAVDVPTADGSGETRYAKGAFVSGDVARRLVEEGFAIEIEPGEQKSRGGAPENK